MRTHALTRGPALAALLVLGSLTACRPDASSRGDGVNEATRALHQLFDDEWERRLDENPLFATSVGDLRNNDQLPTVDPAILEQRVAADRVLLERLASIDADQLSAADRISAMMFERQLRDRMASFELGEWQMPINADSGFHMGFSRLAKRVPLFDTGQYEDYIARMRAWPRLVEEQVANMRTGLERGMTVPRVTLAGYEQTVAPHLVQDAGESVFWEPFEHFPVGVPEGDRERLRGEARAAISEAIVPGYQAFFDFLTEEYIPGARESLAATELPDGVEYYEQQIKTFTTLELSADEIHEIGLREVERIRAEMDAILEQVGYAGRFQEFLDFLRTDRQFYVDTPKQLLAEASYIAKEIDGKLPSLIGTLPRLPYTVQPVPPHIAPKYTAGRYVGPSEGSHQPGIYWVNTYALETRPLYTLTALTLHEAVPGHHLQNALAKEQVGLPNFRRYDYISAFGEGWGLYCEWLGLEAGMYKTPYDQFGRLTYEMWRAVRLVVDTGVHAKGWTREQMIEFMERNTALPLHEIRTEVDRYISWPGQALAYKLGELKIKELRRRAEEQLGTGFDVREFHDVVLRNGSVPLYVLEDEIDGWLAQK